jgi:hypothetical protein
MTQIKTNNVKKIDEFENLLKKINYLKKNNKDFIIEDLKTEENIEEEEEDDEDEEIIQEYDDEDIKDLSDEENDLFNNDISTSNKEIIKLPSSIKISEISKKKRKKN